MKRVKIINSRKDTFWYRKYIGEIVIVEDWSDGIFECITYQPVISAYSTPKLIEKCDCEILPSLINSY